MCRNTEKKGSKDYRESKGEESIIMVAEIWLEAQECAGESAVEKKKTWTGRNVRLDIVVIGLLSG